MDCNWLLTSQWEEVLQSLKYFERPMDTEIEERLKTGNNDLETVAISSVFLPGAVRNSREPDLILSSIDGVQFHMHSHILRLKQAFGALMAGIELNQEFPPVIPLNEPANILNIILHMIYELSCVAFGHNIREIVLAIDRLPAYGVDPKYLIIPSHPIHEYLLYNAPLYPLLIYALASHHDVESLAVACSSHLLTLPLDVISDQMAERIGPIYLKRLFVLRHERTQKLRSLLGEPFRFHPITDDSQCTYDKQRAVSRAWSLAASYLTWDGQPAISTQTLQSTLLSLEPDIECNVCRAELRKRIKKVVTQWSLTKNTI